MRALFKRVARIGEAYPVAHDHYFTAEAVADLARRVAALNARDGCARAAPLRDEIGGGRKVAIHILEFFDRIGYTRRVRDTHVLRGSTRAIRFMNNGRDRSPVGRPVFKTGRSLSDRFG